MANDIKTYTKIYKNLTDTRKIVQTFHQIVSGVVMKKSQGVDIWNHNNKQYFSKKIVEERRQNHIF